MQSTDALSRILGKGVVGGKKATIARPSATFLLLLCLQAFLGMPCARAEAPPAPASSPAPGPPELYFLGVGLEHYSDARIPSFPYAVDDARSLATVLNLQEKRFFGKVHARWIGDRDASRAGLQKELATFCRPASPQDLCVLFIAGRGVVQAGMGRHYLLTWDTMLDRIDTSALDQRELVKTLSASMPARTRVLLIADTLRTVEGGVGAAGRGPGAGYTWSELGAIDEVGSEDTSSWTLYAAGESAVSPAEGAKLRLPVDPEGVAGHGPFANGLLQTLSGRDADSDGDGLLSFQELTGFVARLARTRSGGQLPEVSGTEPAGTLLWAPGTGELCNRVDDNGDGRIDEGFDADGDGHLALDRCGVKLGSDCDDHDPRVHPGQPDVWNYRDDDCDGQIDEDEPDLNHNGIPDPWEGESKRFKRQQWGTLAAGAVLLAGSALTYAQLQGMKPGTSGDYDIEGKVADYQRQSILTVALGGAGTVAVGVSGVFTYQGIRFDNRWIAPRKARGK